jgi:hypothetical protein
MTMNMTALSGLELMRARLDYKSTRKFYKKIQKPSDSINKLLPRRDLESVDKLRPSKKY